MTGQDDIPALAFQLQEGDRSTDQEGKKWVVTEVDFQGRLVMVRLRGVSDSRIRTQRWAGFDRVRVRRAA